MKQSLPLNTRQSKICDDAISREAVRKCFNGTVKMDKDTLPYVEDYLRTVMHRINELPPVTQKSDNKYRKEAKRWKNKWLKSQKSGKWILVSERLPEDGTYLVTVERIDGEPRIDMKSFAKDLHKVDEFDFPKHKCGWYDYDSEYGYWEDTNVIAWMPLPKPYEPQERSDKE